MGVAAIPLLLLPAFDRPPGWRRPGRPSAAARSTVPLWAASAPASRLPGVGQATGIGGFDAVCGGARGLLVRGVFPTALPDTANLLCQRDEFVVGRTGLTPVEHRPQRDALGQVHLGGQGGVEVERRPRNRGLAVCHDRSGRRASIGVITDAVHAELMPERKVITSGSSSAAAKPPRNSAPAAPAKAAWWNLWG